MRPAGSRSQIAVLDAIKRLMDAFVHDAKGHLSTISLNLEMQQEASAAGAPLTMSTPKPLEGMSRLDIALTECNILYDDLDDLGELVSDFATGGFRKTRMLDREQLSSFLETVVRDDRLDLVVTVSDKLPDTFRIPRGLLRRLTAPLIVNSLNAFSTEQSRTAPCKVRILLEPLVGGDGIRLTISDNGPGFPDNPMDIITNRSGRRTGLQILRRLIRALDGVLLLTNTISGAEVDMRLPWKIGD
jgi:signal transduction histidine kinase